MTFPIKHREPEVFKYEANLAPGKDLERSYGPVVRDAIRTRCTADVSPSGLFC